MKKIAFLVALCLMFVHQLNAQTDTTKLSEDDLLLQELGANDIKQSLLPEGMGLIRRSLWGEKGAMRDAVTLNAAFAIAAFKADFNLPLQTQIANGFVLANKAIDSGAALSVVKKWAELTNEIVSAR